MHQIKYLPFLILLFITFGYYDKGFSQTPQEIHVYQQQPQSHFIPQSERELRLAASIHEQIFQDNLDGFIGLLDRYPQYINIIRYYPTYNNKAFTPLQLAVKLGRERFIDELLRREADPTLLTLQGNNTLLHISSLPRITKKLIDLKRIDLETPNSEGLTPLLLQVFKTRLNRHLIHTLLEGGADPNARTPSKLTALHILFMPHHSKSHQGILLAVLQDLLEHDDIEVNAETNDGSTPLHLAVSSNNLQAMQMLLEHDDIAVNAETNDGSTPLHLAVGSNNVPAVQMLLDHGAKIYKRTNDSSTSLHFAAGNNNAQLIQMLIKKVGQMENKNFINWKDSSGNTALSVAYVNQSKEAITELLRLGANPFLQNKLGLSVNGEAHKQSTNSSSFGKFVLDEIDKHIQPSICTPALTRKNDNPLHVSN